MQHSGEQAARTRSIRYFGSSGYFSNGAILPLSQLQLPHSQLRIIAAKRRRHAQQVHARTWQLPPAQLIRTLRFQEGSLEGKPLSRKGQAGKDRMIKSTICSILHYTESLRRLHFRAYYLFLHIRFFKDELQGEAGKRLPRLSGGTAGRQDQGSRSDLQALSANSAKRCGSIGKG